MFMGFFIIPVNFPSVNPKLLNFLFFNKLFLYSENCNLCHDKKA